LFRINNKGQSLFEVLFAIAISGIILVGVVSLATNSVRNTTYSKNKTNADLYIQGAVNWLRQQRDLNWNDFVTHASSGGTTWCLIDLVWSASSGGCGVNDYVTGSTYIKRELTLTITDAVGANIQALVIVSWTDGQGMHEERVVTNFVDWREVDF